MRREYDNREVKPRGFLSSLFKSKNGIYSAIVISLAVSLVLTFIFKNRMFLLIIPILPIQIAFRKFMDYVSGKRKNRLD